MKNRITDVPEGHATVREMKQLQNLGIDMVATAWDRELREKAETLWITTPNINFRDADRVTRSNYKTIKDRFTTTFGDESEENGWIILRWGCPFGGWVECLLIRSVKQPLRSLPDTAVIPVSPQFTLWKSCSDAMLDHSILSEDGYDAEKGEE